MQISSRFTIAIHIFACIDIFKESHKVTRAFLASSINVNPVIIRTIMLQLKKAGLSEVTRDIERCIENESQGWHRGKGRR